MYIERSLKIHESFDNVLLPAIDVYLNNKWFILQWEVLYPLITHTLKIYLVTKMTEQYSS